MTRSQKRDYMSGLIVRWQQSGMSQRSFALKHGLSPHTFKYWLRKFKTHSHGSTDFVELEPEQPTADQQILICYPDGVRVYIPESMPVQMINKLIRG